MATFPRLSQILRFLSAGGLGVSLYYLILYALTDVIGVWYIDSAVIASAVNFGSNFVLQKFWTFGNKRTEKIHREAGEYAVMMVSLFVANLLLLYILVEYVHLWYLAAQVIITTLLTVISYLVSRRIFTS